MLCCKKWKSSATISDAMRGKRNASGTVKHRALGLLRAFR